VTEAENYRLVSPPAAQHWCDQTPEDCGYQALSMLLELGADPNRKNK
jgi:hypothetical protein